MAVWLNVVYVSFPVN